jgi:hypothetical protein
MNLRASQSQSAMFDAMLAFSLLNTLSVKEKVAHDPKSRRLPRREVKSEKREEREIRFFEDYDYQEDAA